MIPGEIVPASETIEGNAGLDTVELEVTNTLDRAVQVTSHYHFFEVNRALRFPREQALGMRLDVPAGMAVRFEPGETRKVRLCAYGGAAHRARLQRAGRRRRERGGRAGGGTRKGPRAGVRRMTFALDSSVYGALYGPAEGTSYGWATRTCSPASSGTWCRSERKA